MASRSRQHRTQGLRSPHCPFLHPPLLPQQEEGGRQPARRERDLAGAGGSWASAAATRASISLISSCKDALRSTASSSNSHPDRGTHFDSAQFTPLPCPVPWSCWPLAPQAEPALSEEWAQKRICTRDSPPSSLSFAEMQQRANQCVPLGTEPDAEASTGPAGKGWATGGKFCVVPAGGTSLEFWR